MTRILCSNSVPIQTPSLTLPTPPAGPERVPLSTIVKKRRDDTKAKRLIYLMEPAASSRVFVAAFDLIPKPSRIKSHSRVVGPASVLVLSKYIRVYLLSLPALYILSCGYVWH